MLGLDLLPVEVLFVDPDLLGQLGDVRDVDLDRAIPERFHELVVQELLVLGLVCVPEDDLVDVRLRELLRLDLVLLRRAEQIVEERDVELQHLDELDDAAVGDVELAVEVEGARVGVGAVLGDLAVVDVASELGRVLVLLVLRLEGADADAVLLGEDHAADAHVRHHLRPVTLVLGHEVLEDVAARRIEVPVHVDAELLVREPELVDDLLPPLERDESQGLIVHGAREALGLERREADAREVHPVERVEGAVGRARVRLDAELEQARDRALRAPDRAMEQDDALLGAVPFGGRLEHVHEPHERDVEAVDRVGAVPRLVLEEVVTDELLLVVDVLLGAVAHDHVVEALVRVARDLRPLTNDRQVLLERALPMQLLVQLEVLHRGDPLGHPGHCRSLGHRFSLV